MSMLFSRHFLELDMQPDPIHIFLKEVPLSWSLMPHVSLQNISALVLHVTRPKVVL